MKKFLFFLLFLSKVVDLYPQAVTKTPHPLNAQEQLATIYSAPGGAQPVSFTSFQIASKFYSPDGKYMTNTRSKPVGVPLAAGVSCGAKHDIPTAAKFASHRIQSSPTLRAARHVYQPSAYDQLFSSVNLEAQWKKMITVISQTGSAYTTLLDAETTQNILNGKTTSTTLSKSLTAHDTIQNYPNVRAISYFVPIFRKIQFCVLHDLYTYLTALYSTFTLTHANSADYAILSEQTAINRKSLIVNEFLNIIQTQMQGICSAQAPTQPTHMAIRAGSSALSHDCTGDLLILLQDYNAPLWEGDDGTSEKHKQLANQLESARKEYLTALGTVIQFFTAYTNILTETTEDTCNQHTYAKFIQLAQAIQDINDNDEFNVQGKAISQLSSIPQGPTVQISSPPQTSQEEKAARARVLAPQQPLLTKFTKLRQLKDTTKSINPLFFYYDNQTFRAIKLIVKTAQALQGSSLQNVPLPEFLITQAIQATKNNPQALITTNGNSYPVAFVEGPDCTILKANIDPQNNPEQSLYINLRTAQGPFTQEIKRQPDWLNDPIKIVQMLQACLGNWLYLVGDTKIDTILDPCTERLIGMALDTLKNGSVTLPEMPSTIECSQIINQITKVQQQYKQKLPPGTNPTPQGNYCSPQGKT